MFCIFRRMFLYFSTHISVFVYEFSVLYFYVFFCIFLLIFCICLRMFLYCSTNFLYLFMHLYVLFYAFFFVCLRIFLHFSTHFLFLCLYVFSRRFGSRKTFLEMCLFPVYFCVFVGVVVLPAIFVLRIPVFCFFLIRFRFCCFCLCFFFVCLYFFLRGTHTRCHSWIVFVFFTSFVRVSLCVFLICSVACFCCVLFELFIFKTVVFSGRPSYSCTWSGSKKKFMDQMCLMMKRNRKILGTTQK